MAGRIQANPIGLLNLLGLKTTGANPSLFPDHIQGVLEVGNRYELSTMKLLQATKAMDNGQPGDQYVSLFVPPGQLYHLLFLSVQSDMGVGVTANGAFGLRLSGTSGSPELYLTDDRALTGPSSAPPAFGQVITTFTAPEGLLLGPGTNVFWSCWNNSDLGTSAINTHLRALVTTTPI